MLVKKGNGIYLYQSIREEGVVRTKYCGQLTQKQIHEHQRRKEEEEVRKQSHRDISALLDDLDAFRTINDLLIRAQILCHHGHYFRKSEMRTIRRINNAY
jgi:hypothetical protein